MTKKRDKLTIIHDMLLVINSKRKIKPTQLLHSSNLSPQMFKEYLALLIQKNFINENKIENKKVYSLTPRGQEFLSEYRIIQNTIRNFGL